ncbi:hypothetical protein NEF87_001936 [Candidatus Lokiarchaeum ossiferum]|uniref:Uncharacterized protein n=1 Tax=Candidatus Lokiarchaeum ossiferum TaxID=2951803 RepID=A0ABY6HQE7_9ARCH|nr:hypothetical protein NEF87_001936 [Candidatus Lokiarchaeum sp. B-35]
MAKLVARDLDKIQFPILESHSQKDHDIDPIITQWISDATRGTVEIWWFNESGHTMPLDVQGAEICEAIAPFLKKFAMG